MENGEIEPISSIYNKIYEYGPFILMLTYDILENGIFTFGCSTSIFNKEDISYEIDGYDFLYGKIKESEYIMII